MNIHDANRFIEAYNAQAKAAVLMATAWEELAWGMVEDHAEARGLHPAMLSQILLPNPEEYPNPQGFHPRAAADFQSVQTNPEIENSTLEGENK